MFTPAVKTKIPFEKDGGDIVSEINQQVNRLGESPMHMKIKIKQSLCRYLF